MKVTDFTATVSPRVVSRPGRRSPRWGRLSSTENGDSSTVGEWTLGAHTGTRMDVRAHFELGGRTIEALDSARIVGPSQVVDVTGIEGHVERADLEAVSRTEQERALLEPRNSLAGPMEKEGCPEIPKGAAEYLVELGVETVGVAYLSVEPFEDEELKKHQKLLGADLVTPEGLVLRDVGPGDYLPACLPLKLEGSGGSPAWAVLVSDPQGGHA